MSKRSPYSKEGPSKKTAIYLMEEDIEKMIWERERKEKKKKMTKTEESR